MKKRAEMPSISKLDAISHSMFIVVARGEDYSHVRLLPNTTSVPRAFLSRPLPKSGMASTPHPQKTRDAVLPTLDVFIQALNIAKDACGIPPAQIALGSASTLLTMIRARSPCSAKTNG